MKVIMKKRTFRWFFNGAMVGTSISCNAVISVRVDQEVVKLSKTYNNLQFTYELPTIYLSFTLNNL